MSLRRLAGTIPYTGAYTSPGAMSHRISVYQKGARQSDGTYAADSLFKTVWSAFRVMQGKELDQAKEVSSDVEVVFSVFYVEGLDASMTVVRGAESYTILYINDPDGRRVEQRIYARLLNQEEK